MQAVHKSVSGQAPEQSPMVSVDALVSTPGTPEPPVQVVYVDGRVATDDMVAMREISRQLAVDTSPHLFTAMRAASAAAAEALADAGAPPDPEAGFRGTVASIAQRVAGAAANTALLGTAASAAGSGGHVTYEKHMSFVADALRALKARGTGVVLVLDEVDAFARQSKQTLLYHLLDLTQSTECVKPLSLGSLHACLHLLPPPLPHSAAFAVIGMTARLDVVDLLEKRLRSRFSHSQVLFSHPEWPTYCAVARAALTLPAAAGSQSPGRRGQTMQSEDGIDTWNAAVQAALPEGLDPEGASPATTPCLARHLHEAWSTGHSIGWMLRLLDTVVSQAPSLQDQVVDAAVAGATADPRIALLAGLTQVEMCLLIAMAHLEQRGEAEYNFQGAWRQYRRFASGEHAASAALPQAVAVKSFQHLVALDLVAYAQGTAAARGEAVAAGATKARPSAALGGSAAGATVVSQQYDVARLQLSPVDILAAVASGAVAVPTSVKQWAAAGSVEAED